MRWRDKALLAGLIWVFVYPGVLLMSYAFLWLGIEVPLWIELGISTAVTVPLISLVAAPLVERVVAAAKGESAAEMKVEQAREAPGPDPEEIVGRGR
jgi:antibiotic biosynthesis monooxygenase (ABM) superfamily enzyme